MSVLTRKTDIPDDLLWSYVEGRLEARTSDAIARYLQQHPELRRSVRVMRRQQELLNMVDPNVLEEPVPARLSEVIERARRWFPGNGAAKGDSEDE